MKHNLYIVEFTCHRLTKLVDEVGTADFAIDLALDEELCALGVGDAGYGQK